MVRVRKFASSAIVSLLFAAFFAPASPVWAQGGWRRIGDQPASQQMDPEPVARGPEQAPPVDQGAPPLADPEQAPPPAALPPAPAMVPPEVTAQPGTLLNVRINETLSSERNSAGDTFSAELMQPLVVGGVVVAARGQTVYGRVAEASRASANTPSHLALQLTELSLVDGRQIPVSTQLAGFRGHTAPAVDQASTVINTTTLGAMIGGMAGRGVGAVTGAGVGAAAGAIAVLLTRNRPTVVNSESELTFRFDAPLTIATAEAPLAFRFATPEDYARPAAEVRRRPAEPRCANCGPNYPPPFWGPVWGGDSYGRGYGTGIAVIFGSGGYRRR